MWQDARHWGLGLHYGLGIGQQQDLPAFVVMCDSGGKPVNGPRNWGSGFMPATHQGVRINGASDEPIADLNPPERPCRRRAATATSLRCCRHFNQTHAQMARPQQSELEARIRSYELAFRMQAEAPEAVDLTQETSKQTQALYGLDQKETETFGRNCLLARRLVERGVRFCPAL